jgi:lipoyl(octanoyl) transferase
MNDIINKKVFFRHLGTIDYKEAWDYQTEIFNKVIAGKIANRELTEKRPTDNYLFFCEHPHVYTLGKSGLKENLLASPEILDKKRATFYESNRGGDITYHGPGQIVGYPILDLDNFFTDIHKYMRSLEEAVILTLKEYNIEAGRIAGMTGVWLDAENPGQSRKICAFGVKTSRWVTMHGFAFNVNTDLSYFENIIPCGISDKAVTSLDLELGYKLDMKEVEYKLLHHLANIFGMEIINYTWHH